MTIATTVSRALTENGTHYDLLPHPRTGSSHETAQAAHVPDDHMAKAVMLVDTKGYLMVVLPGDQWVNLDRVNTELNRDFDLVTEEELDTLFSDCARGAIPPLGELYGIDTVMDDGLTSLSRVYFESGDHEQLIQLDGEQFRQLMRGVRHGYFGQVH
jgi:Ala-tRNA(Pro) deacylase